METRSPWWAVAGCFVALIGEGIGTFIAGPTMKPITADFGWTRTEFTLSGLWVSLAMMVGVPLAGQLVDRGWARGVLGAGAVLLGLALLGQASMQSLGEFWVLASFMGLGTGLLGGIPTAALLARWFDQRRGLAIGIAGTGDAIAGLLLAPTLHALLGSGDWRRAYLYVAVFILAVLLPAIFFLIRDPGATRMRAISAAGSARLIATAAGDNQANLPVAQITLRQGLRSLTFWALGFAMFLHVFYFSGIIVHFIALATDTGLSAKLAAIAFGSTIGLGIAGRIGGGWLGDRLSPRRVATVALAATAVAALLLHWVDVPVALWSFVLLHGLGIATTQAVIPLVVAASFGANNIGTFLGATMLFQVPGGVLGAIAAAASFDQLGGYSPIITVWVVGNTLAALAIAATRPVASAALPGVPNPTTQVSSAVLVSRSA